MWFSLDSAGAFTLMIVSRPHQLNRPIKLETLSLLLLSSLLLLQAMCTLTPPLLPLHLCNSTEENHKSLLLLRGFRLKNSHSYLEDTLTRPFLKSEILKATLQFAEKAFSLCTRFAWI